MAHYESVNGIYRKVNKIYVPTDGIYRDAKKRYDPVDGVYRQTFSGGGMTVGDLAVGTRMIVLRWGRPVPCIVIHQGKPSADYDDSCDGTWLMTESILSEAQWSGAADLTSYSMSNANNVCLNWIAMLDEPGYSAVKTVKPPNYGAAYVLHPEHYDDFEAKAFLLSSAEVGVQDSYTIHGVPAGKDGAVLDYFKDCGAAAEPKRVAYLNGTATAWWTRTEIQSSSAMAIYTDGEPTVPKKHNSRGIRPAFVLDSSTRIDPEGLVIIP